jgi:hypothetical protein
MSTFTPTAQQARFLDVIGDGRGIVCQAGAGAGKTTVMKQGAAKLVGLGQRGIYTAFNKAIVDSAKASMPRGVTAATTYSIAWNAGGRVYGRTLNIKGQTLRDAAKILRINNPLYLGQDVSALAPPKVARLALRTVEAFCASADRELSAVHVPEVAGAEDARAAIVAAVLPAAIRAWEDMGDPLARHGGGQLRTKHGLYFKRWALTDPKIEADFVMVDEVQDTDPVLAGVLRGQEVPLYLIGDDAQMIYGWRGCVSIMGDFPAFHQLQLTRSFRFGDAVADEANKFLDVLGATIRIEGHSPVPSVVGPIGAPDAVLTRSNAAAVAAAIAAAKDGRKVHLKGAGDDVRALAEGAAELMQGRQAWHPELEAFRSWGDVQQYVEDGMASTELENTVRLLETHGVDEVVAAIASTVPEAYADVTVTTTHKVKGLEWDRVQIGEDWFAPRRGEQPSPELLMLGYVAVTRAKLGLDRGSLEWIDDFAGEVLGAGLGVAAPAAVVPVAAPAPAAVPAGLPRGTAAAVEALRAAGWVLPAGASAAELAGAVGAAMKAFMSA